MPGHEVADNVNRRFNFLPTEIKLRYQDSVPIDSLVDEKCIGKSLSLLGQSYGTHTCKYMCGRN